MAWGKKAIRPLEILTASKARRVARLRVWLRRMRLDEVLCDCMRRLLQSFGQPARNRRNHRAITDVMFTRGVRGIIVESL